MTLTFSITVAALLTGALLLYMQTARRLGLMDLPNHRSSHTDGTIVRSGGVVFWLAALMIWVYNDFRFWSLFTRLTAGAAVSFLDDLRTVPKRYRLAVQGVAVGLLLHETGIYLSDYQLLLIALVVGVGVLNAYNFMDGINGITALYSLVTVGTLWYWQCLQPVVAPDGLFACVSIALLIFSWFNVRRQAVCFAGDVGSVSIALIILYLLMQRISQTQTYLPVLLLAVYGVDTGLTIGHRLYQRQNIMQAHRQHLFQWLVHRLGWPHLSVSVLYAGLQLGINVLVLSAVNWFRTGRLLLAATVLLLLVAVYVILKRRLMAIQDA